MRKLPGERSAMDVPDHFFDDFIEDLADPDCVQEIYDFTLSQVRGLVRYNDEDDLIQEVFYRLAKWPIGNKYNSKRHYFALLKVTIRQAIAAYWKRWHSQRNDVRKRRYISELQADESCKFEFEGQTENLLHALHIKEVAKRLRRKVTTLNQRQRIMFQLRFIEEKPHDEISTKLGISIRTSYRLEAQLRESLREYLGTEPDCGF